MKRRPKTAPRVPPAEPCPGPQKRPLDAELAGAVAIDTPWSPTPPHTMPAEDVAQHREMAKRGHRAVDGRCRCGETKPAAGGWCSVCKRRVAEWPSSTTTVEGP